METLRMALVLAWHLLPLFPNKRAAGSWTITDVSLENAITEALVRHKIKVDKLNAEIEILWAEGRDKKRLSARAGQ